MLGKSDIYLRGLLPNLAVLNNSSPFIHFRIPYCLTINQKSLICMP